MDRTREGTGYGINPLQPVQIAAWMRIRGISPTAWQLDAIDRMDATRMRVYFENSAKAKEPEQEVSERPLTSRLFDALFPKR